MGHQVPTRCKILPFYLDPLVFKLELDVQRITVSLLVLSLRNLDKNHLQKVIEEKQLDKCAADHLVVIIEDQTSGLAHNENVINAHGIQICKM